jgi:hypothetical protein
VNHLEVPQRETTTAGINSGFGQRTACKLKGFRVFRDTRNIGCIGPGNEVSKQRWTYKLTWTILLQILAPRATRLKRPTRRRRFAEQRPIPN